MRVNISYTRQPGTGWDESRITLRPAAGK